MEQRLDRPVEVCEIDSNRPFCGVWALESSL